MGNGQSLLKNFGPSPSRLCLVFGTHHSSKTVPTLFSTCPCPVVPSHSFLISKFSFFSHPLLYFMYAGAGYSTTIKFSKMNVKFLAFLLNLLFLLPSFSISTQHLLKLTRVDLLEQLGLTNENTSVGASEDGRLDALLAFGTSLYTGPLEIGKFKLLKRKIFVKLQRKCFPKIET
jgi:hypothetical protein